MNDVIDLDFPNFENTCGFFDSFVGICIHKENEYKSCRETRCPVAKGFYSYNLKMCSYRSGICPKKFDENCGACEERKRIKRSKELQ